MHKEINLDTSASQLLTPAANNDVPLPLSVCPSAVDTTVIDYSSATSSTPIERNENEVENKAGYSYVIYAWDLSSVAHMRVGIAGKVFMNRLMRSWL